MLLTLFAAACDRPAADRLLAGVPLSPQLERAVADSRASLRSGDRGDPRVHLAVDRYLGLQRLLYNPDTRAAGADSLFALWEADLTNFLWPELAARNWHLLDRGRVPAATFLHPAFADTTAAVGAYVNAWRTYNYSSGGEGFRAADAARDALDPLQRHCLRMTMIWLNRYAGRDAEAVALALAALPAARELGGWRLEMMAWAQLARALKLGDHLDDALHAVRMAETLAAAVAERTGDASYTLHLWELRADILGARSEFAAAFPLYAAEKDSALAGGMTYLASRALHKAASLTSRTEDYELGLELVRESLRIAVAGCDSFNAPRLMINIADRHRLLGHVDSCRVYQERAEAWIDAYPNPQNRARLPLYQAQYHAHIGDYARVDSLHAAAAARMPNMSTVEKLAELHLQLIREGIERGRPAVAYRSIAVLDSLRGRLGDTRADRNVEVDLDLHTAHFMTLQGRYREAAAALERASVGLERRPDRTRRWTLEKRRGELARARGDLISAEAAFRACVSLSEDRGGRDRRIESRLLLGSALLARGRFPEVRSLFPRPEGDAFGGRFRTRLTAGLMRGIAYAREGLTDDALREFERAAARFTPWTPPDLVARFRLETGRAEARAGRPAEARAIFDGVAAGLERWAAGGAARTLMFLQSDLRRDLVEARLALAVGASGACRGAAAERALREAGETLPDWRGASGAAEQAFRAPQLIYFVGADASYRWSVAEAGVSLTALPGADALADLTAPVVADLSRPGRRSVPGETAALLEALGGAPEGWPAEATLTVVPDGVLFGLPWCALPLDAAGGEIWLERGPIVLADAPVVAPAAGVATDAPRDAAAGRILALGVDGGAGVAAAGLPRLRNAEKEAREVASLWPAERRTLLVGEAADWRAVAPETLAARGVIHIASHALVYRGAAEQTTLLLAGGGEPLTSGEIRELKLNADLVFLSCCEAAEGFGGGAAYAGLAKSFLAAGAGLVVAPTVKLDDETARHIAGRFYEALLSGEPAPRALRRAQLALRRGDERWSHPCHWCFHQAMMSPRYLSPIGPNSQSEK